MLRETKKAEVAKKKEQARKKEKWEELAKHQVFSELISRLSTVYEPYNYIL